MEAKDCIGGVNLHVEAVAMVVAAVVVVVVDDAAAAEDDVCDVVLDMIVDLMEPCLVGATRN